MKKYLFGILALTLAIGFSAFTTKKTTSFAIDEFVFVGDPRVQSQVTDNTKWHYVGQSQTPSNELMECETGSLVCTIDGTVTTAQELAVFDANSKYSLDPTKVSISAPNGNSTTGFIAQFTSTYSISELEGELAD